MHNLSMGSLMKFHQVSCSQVTTAWTREGWSTNSTGVPSTLSQATPTTFYLFIFKRLLTFITFE